MTTYEELKAKPRTFLAATSLTVEEFEELLLPFSEADQARYGADKTVEGEPRQRRTGGGAKGKLPRMEDKLLFILVYEKTYPLQTMQGLHFGLSQGQTNIWALPDFMWLTRQVAVWKRKAGILRGRAKAVGRV